MSSINYFKLDLRIMKGTLKHYMIIPVFFLLMLSTDAAMGIGYLFFFLLITVSVPFSIESNEKCNTMYYMFPSKVHSMVLGRFLFLIITSALIWLISSIVMVYFYHINKISIMEIGVICLTGIASTIICFCQYPFYYKFGLEKGRVLSIVLYMLPAFAVFLLPSFLGGSNLITPETLNNALNFAVQNKAVLMIFSMVIVAIVGIISYLISCFICEKKEI